MPFAQGSIGFEPMVAWITGALVVVGCVLLFLLAAYAIYWMIFKMGKD